jgi:hypothetical protein
MDSNVKMIAAAIGILIIGIGAGYGISWALDDSTDDVEYSFYLHFEDDDERNGWYSGTASSAGDGFKNAMDKAEFEFKINEHGYVGTIDEAGVLNGWYVCQYLYESTDSDAAEASIKYPIEEYGTLKYSNGWKPISGYDVDDDPEVFKLSQMNSEIYFLSVYNDDWSAKSPVDAYDSWKDKGIFSN